MLIGIGLFGAITANLAAVFIEQRDDELADELEEINDRLTRIERALAGLGPDCNSGLDRD